MSNFDANVYCNICDYENPYRTVANELCATTETQVSFQSVTIQ